MNDKSLEEFIREKIMDLGTAACPPYHLALVIGGTSAEANLAAVKKHLLNILTTFLQKEIWLVKRSEFRMGKKSAKKFVRNLQSERNLVENT